MPNSSNHSCFSNGETVNFSFFRIPRSLVKDDRFRGLSSDSKLLYGLMLDRICLSLKNNWQDAEGRAFIYFTLEEIQTTLSCGHNKAVHLMAELEQYDLIKRVKQGQGKPAKIYVKNVGTDNTDKQNCDQEPKPIDLQTSEKSTCRLPVSKRLDFLKRDRKYTEKNYTEFSYINPSINPNHLQPTSPPSRGQTTYQDSAAGSAVPASMSFVKHKRPLVRGQRPLETPGPRKYVSP